MSGVGHREWLRAQEGCVAGELAGQGLRRKRTESAQPQGVGPVDIQRVEARCGHRARIRPREAFGREFVVGVLPVPDVGLRMGFTS